MTYDPFDRDGDPMRPPAISTLVHCIHCNEEYDSFRIEWRVKENSEGKLHGFWCCPIPGCTGMGFGCDIFPVDPEYRDENGELMWCSDEDEVDGGDSRTKTTKKIGFQAARAHRKMAVMMRTTIYHFESFNSFPYNLRRRRN